MINEVLTFSSLGGFLSTVGGFASAMLFIGKIAIGPFNQTKFEATLAENLFSYGKEHRKEKREDDIEEMQEFIMN